MVTDLENVRMPGKAVEAEARRAAVRACERFDLFVQTHEQYVMRLAWRLLGYQDMDVDDVVQDVFVAAWKKMEQYRGDGQVKNWLGRITVNRCRDVLRKRMFINKLYRLWPWREGKEPDTEAGRHDVRDERLVDLHRAVGTLPQRMREVIVLHYLEGMAVAKMAVVLRITENAVQVRLSRARQVLRERMNETMGVEDE